MADTNTTGSAQGATIQKHLRTPTESGLTPDQVRQKRTDRHSPLALGTSAISLPPQCTQTAGDQHAAVPAATPLTGHRSAAAENENKQNAPIDTPAPSFEEVGSTHQPAPNAAANAAAGATPSPSDDEWLDDFVDELRIKQEETIVETKASERHVRLAASGRDDTVSNLQHHIVVIATPSEESLKQVKKFNAKGKREVSADSGSFRVALSDLLAQWKITAAITGDFSLEVVKVLPKISDAAPAGAIYEVSTTSADLKKVFLKKSTSYSQKVATYTVHFHDKDLYARPTRFDTSSYTEFIIDPIVYYDAQKGQEVTLTVSEMAACCNIAGMMPEMFTIQPQRKMDNTGVGCLTRKFSLFVPNGFTEYYTIQKGPSPVILLPSLRGQ